MAHYPTQAAQDSGQVVMMDTPGNPTGVDQADLMERQRMSTPFIIISIMGLMLSIPTLVLNIVVLGKGASGVKDSILFVHTGIWYGTTSVVYFGLMLLVAVYAMKTKPSPGTAKATNPLTTTLAGIVGILLSLAGIAAFFLAIITAIVSLLATGGCVYTASTEECSCESPSVSVSRVPSCTFVSRTMSLYFFVIAITSIILSAIAITAGCISCCTCCCASRRAKRQSRNQTVTVSTVTQPVVAQPVVAQPVAYGDQPAGAFGATAPPPYEGTEQADQGFSETKLYPADDGMKPSAPPMY